MAWRCRSADVGEVPSPVPSHGLSPFPGIPLSFILPCGEVMQGAVPAAHESFIMVRLVLWQTESMSWAHRGPVSGSAGTREMTAASRNLDNLPTESPNHKNSFGRGLRRSSGRSADSKQGYHQHYNGGWKHQLFSTWLSLRVKQGKLRDCWWCIRRPVGENTALAWRTSKTMQ